MIDREKLSSVIRLLFDKATELDAQKIDVTLRTLSDAAPNHSKRDYQKAIDIFDDFKSELASTSLPMPNELKSWFDKGILGMWAKGCSWFNEQKVLIEKTADEKVAMARKDRDEVNDKCEALTHQIQELSAELSEEKSTNQQLSKELANYKEELQQSRQDISVLTAKVAELKSTVEILRDGICSKIQKFTEKSKQEVIYCGAGYL